MTQSQPSQNRPYAAPLRAVRRGWHLIAHRNFCFVCDSWTVRTHRHAETQIHAHRRRKGWTA